MSNELAWLDTASKAIAKVATVGEAKAITDRASAIKMFAAKQGWSTKEKTRIAEIELQATARLGELLRDQPKNKGAVPGKTGSKGKPVLDSTPTLASLGVSKKQSQTAQAVASADPARRAAYVAECRESGTLPTVSKMVRIARRSTIKVKPAAPLPSGSFDCILADPPWEYDFAETESRAIDNHYPTMSMAEMAAMTIPAAPNSALFLWATSPKLREAFTLIDAWGYTYKTHAIWDKEKIGMGYWFRGRHELLLVATKGKVSPPEQSRRKPSVFSAPRTKHSRKPELVYSLIESMLPNATRLELFAREQHVGWTAWGNQV